FVEAETLTAIFIVLAFLVAAQFAFMPRGVALADALPREPFRALIGVAIGFFSSLMGIGGGSFTVPTLTFCGSSMGRSGGRAPAGGFAVAIPGMRGVMGAGWGDPRVPLLSLGYVNFLGFTLIVPVTVVMAPLGARVTHSVNAVLRRRFFARFLAISA